MSLAVPGLVSVPVVGVDLLTVVAFLLLLAGVAGAVVPSAPAALLSVAGVLVYWWASGFTEPGTLALAALLGTGLLAVLADWLGGVVAARVSGASTSSAAIAGVVGLALLVVTGPVGMLVGATATVFLVEYARRRDARSGLAAAGGYLVGFFASALAQLLLTGAILVAMVAIAL